MNRCSLGLLARLQKMTIKPTRDSLRHPSILLSIKPSVTDREGKETSKGGEQRSSLS